MKKLIAESLQEFNNEPVEKINESFSSGGKLFRELFLPATYSMIKAGRKKEATYIMNMAKKQKSWGWPKLKELEDKLASGFSKFETLLDFMGNQKPSMSVSAGSGASVNAGGSGNSSSKEQASAIAEFFGMKIADIRELLTK